MAIRPVEKRGPGGGGLGGAIGLGQGLLGLASLIPGPQQPALMGISALGALGAKAAEASQVPESQKANALMGVGAEGLNAIGGIANAAGRVSSSTPLQTAAENDLGVQVAQMMDARDLLLKAPVNKFSLEDRKRGLGVLDTGIKAITMGKY